MNAPSSPGAVILLVPPLGAAHYDPAVPLRELTRRCNNCFFQELPTILRIDYSSRFPLPYMYLRLPQARLVVVRPSPPSFRAGIRPVEPIAPWPWGAGSAQTWSDGGSSFVRKFSYSKSILNVTKTVHLYNSNNEVGPGLIVTNAVHLTKIDLNCYQKNCTFVQVE